MTLIDNTQQVDVSEQRRLPVDNVGTDKIVPITGETAQMYYYNATTGVYTIDAGQAAGIGVVAKLAHRNVKNAAGDVTGTYKDSSLSFTSTALIKERAFPYIEVCKFDADTGASKLATAISGFNNGEYCVDYRTGMIYGKKASTQVTLTATAYKVETSTSTTPAGVQADVNVAEILGTATNVNGGNRDAGTQTFTLADDDPAVASLGVMDDWDNAASDGASVSGDTAHDSPDAGEPVKIGGKAATSEPTAVANSDRVDAYFDENGRLHIVGKNFDTGTSAGKDFEINPLSDHHEESTLAAVTDGTDGTYAYYVDMDGYRNFALQTTLSGGSGTATMTVEATLQDDGTAAASCTYVDVTTALFGAASYTASGYHAVDTPVPIKYLKVKIVAATGAANDADWTLYFKKQY